MQKIVNKFHTFLKADAGYSLIELLVAMGLFAVVVSITASMFMLSLRGQQKAFTAQNVADNVRYAMEIMSKEIRMGSVFPASGSLPFQFKSNMPNRNGATVQFGLSGGQITFDDDISDAVAATPITSANINVTALSFYLYTPLSSPLDKQKRVLITIQANSAGIAADASSSITLETVVAPRKLQ